MSLKEQMSVWEKKNAADRAAAQPFIDSYKWEVVQRLLKELLNSPGNREPHEWYDVAETLLHELERD
jgi:hypothetical protein